MHDFSQARRILKILIVWTRIFQTQYSIANYQLVGGTLPNFDSKYTNFTLV